MDIPKEVLRGNFVALTAHNKKEGEKWANQSNK